MTLSAERILDAVDEVAPGIKIIFRSLVAGHRDCLQASHPASPLDEPGAGQFNWGEFAAFNKIWRTALANRTNSYFLDIDAYTHLRPDGHRYPYKLPYADCLHYCSPG
jgi:hypothetical protein